MFKIKIRKFILIAQTKKQSQTKKYTKPMMYNIIWFKQQNDVQYNLIRSAYERFEKVPFLI